MKRFLLVIFAIFFAQTALAAELSPKSLEGSWHFSHMYLDGSTKERKVNTIMQFNSDGTLINNPNDPAKRSEATYKVPDSSTIIYKDKNGEQTWKVKEFSDTEMKADHKGALMVFKRQ